MPFVGIILSFIFVYTHFRRDLLRWNSKHYSQFVQFTHSLVLLSSNSDCYCYRYYCYCRCCMQFQVSRSQAELYYRKIFLLKHQHKCQIKGKILLHTFLHSNISCIVFYLPLYLMDFSSLLFTAHNAQQTEQSDPWIFWSKCLNISLFTLKMLSITWCKWFFFVPMHVHKCNEDDFQVMSNEWIFCWQRNLLDRLKTKQLKWISWIIQLCFFSLNSHLFDELVN